MAKNIKVIVIVIGFGAVIFMVYTLFFKESGDTENLVSSVVIPALPAGDNFAGGIAEASSFLTLLLSVKDIRLNDAIFDDVAFNSLDGSNSILLEGDGSEGRPNPFAPFSSEVVVPPSGVSGGRSSSPVDPEL